MNRTTKRSPRPPDRGTRWEPTDADHEGAERARAAMEDSGNHPAGYRVGTAIRHGTVGRRYRWEPRVSPR